MKVENVSQCTACSGRDTHVPWCVYVLLEVARQRIRELEFAAQQVAEADRACTCVRLAGPGSSRTDANVCPVHGLPGCLVRR